MTERRRWEFNIQRLRKQWTDIQKAEVFPRDFDHAAGGVWCAKPSCRTLITEKDVEFVTLHHLTKLGNVGTNFTENKKLAHYTCNSSLKQPQIVASLPGEREIPTLPRILGSQSEKSGEMVAAYDACIRDRDPWRKYDKQGTFTGEFFEEIALEWMLSKMPVLLGHWETDGDTGERVFVKLGVSESYRKYVLTDGASARLKLDKKKGKWWVRYIGELQERTIPTQTFPTIPTKEETA